MPSTSTRLEYIPDHEQRTSDLLPGQFKTKPRWCSLMRALGAAVQLLEDANFDSLAGGTLDTATGDALGQWGDIVGEDKDALFDEEYRLIIRSRVLANISGGTRDEVIELYRSLTSPGIPRHDDVFPASYFLITKRGTAMRDEYARRVRRVMEDARPMGIGQTLIESQFGGFQFDPPPGAGFDIGTFSRVLP